MCAGVFATPPTAQVRGSAKKPAPKAGAPAPAAKTVAPFRAGETLDFSGQWLGMSGAITASLSIPEQRNVFGKDAWHFRAQLHTNNPLRYLVTVDDEFDAYAAQAELAGLQFEMYLHESGKSETHQLRMITGNESPQAGTNAVQVPQGTRDPMGMLYFLRTVDWQKSNEARGPVFDGRKMYDVRAQLADARQEITVASGRYSASGIAIRVFENGNEMTNTKLKLWIAQDAARTPVLLEMELPIGTGRVELVKAVAGKP
ncbi:MAG TPA: DUF3108 domain-containing protein [Candidatus Acidoferrales bacterium]|nr:DUF3108 domain-containing protein [Candidatus Acidoferrales bacterium]